MVLSLPKTRQRREEFAFIDRSRTFLPAQILINVRTAWGRMRHNQSRHYVLRHHAAARIHANTRIGASWFLLLPSGKLTIQGWSDADLTQPGISPKSFKRPIKS